MCADLDTGVNPVQLAADLGQQQRGTLQLRLLPAAGLLPLHVPANQHLRTGNSRSISTRGRASAGQSTPGDGQQGQSEHGNGQHRQWVLGDGQNPAPALLGD